MSIYTELVKPEGRISRSNLKSNICSALLIVDKKRLNFLSTL